MEIVIEISEEDYKLIKSYGKGSTNYRISLNLYDAVRDGTPLPEHHGDLIERRCGNKVCNGCEHSDICDTYKAPTIIEGE